MYIGGYAIETSLASWLCLVQQVNDLEKTKEFQRNKITGSKIHNLSILGDFPATLQLRTLHEVHWNFVVETWKYNELRYSRYVGDNGVCTQFIEAVTKLHHYILPRI